MATTTYEDARDQQIVLIRALVSASLSSTRFLVNLDEIDFRAWALDNPQCMRRFGISDNYDYELPEVSNNDLEWVVGTQEIVVAYPSDMRYGPNNNRDKMDIIRADQRLIDDTVGPYGLANLSNFHLALGDLTIEEAGPVTFGVITHTFRFYRSPNS